MQLAVDKKNRLTVPDDLSDYNLEQFYGNLNLLLDKRPNEIFLDCSQLLRATSTHINILWDARYSCNKAGIQMHLVSISASLLRVLKVLDLYDLLVTHKDQDSESPERRVIPEIDPDNNVIEIEFKATDRNIRSSIVKLKDFLGKPNLEEISILEIETIFYEVATNIRLHAQISDKDLIQLTVTLCRDKIVLKFIYPGISFDPVARVKDYDPGAVIKQRQKRGYGLIMINRMADEISYERTDNNLNELYIEKYWGGSND